MYQKSKLRSFDRSQGGILIPAKSRLLLVGRYCIVHRDRLSNVLSEEDALNRIVNAGLNYLLDTALSGGTAITAWFLGLKNAGTIAAADVMNSHAGWTENQNYDEATRLAWAEAGATGQSITNAASPAVFTCSTNGQAIAGVFLTSGSVKGGTTGTLFSAVDFLSVKNLDDGETLTVTYTVGAADDGV